ncbi:unnamed protein product [Urochloa humidicola]
MDPQLQKILDELKSVGNSVADLKVSLTGRIDEVDKALGARFESLEAAAQVLEDWKPKVDASIDDLRIEVGAMRKTVNRVVLDVSPTSSAGIFPKPVATSLPSSSKAEGALEFRDEKIIQGREFGAVFTHTHDSAEGKFSEPPKSLHRSNSQPHIHRHGSQLSPEHHQFTSEFSMGRLPKLNFPMFEGENPKMWISRSEDYFDLYQVPSHRWIKVASMHFAPSSPAGRWLQSVEKRIKGMSWHEFCQLVLDRFGKEHHELLIRQLFHIKQLTSVADYIERFSGLVDLLTTYETHTDPLYFSMKFVDGLKPEIRSAVLVQRPQDLDSACVLALLQEEVTDGPKKKEFRQPDYFPLPKTPVKQAFPLPQPPKVEKAEDRRHSDASRGKSTDEKLSALRSYRRARGLCVKCAEKWSRDHRCPDSVQLHVIQELWELCQLEEEDLIHHKGSDDSSEQLFLAISESAVSGIEGPRTMRFQGTIQDKEVLILIDSGSSNTFISTALADQLRGVLPLEGSLSVKVANGDKLACASHLPGGVWSVQGCSFTSDLKVLPLMHYDVIVGMDWLESFSPMKVHWKEKWMLIPYLGTHSLLQGIAPVIPEGSVVEVCAVLVTDTTVVKLEVPPELSQLLDTFGDVFEAPSGLPPSRSCDHTIPLVDGATPVSVRPYRYPPAIKDEIERQIVAMLKEGIIQHSVSPFSSSVLLVKKKDQSWRFCVDFRHLNAITLKCKYPVPLIDDFLDELGKASWFTSLDLTAGYHQIRLKPGEAYKTAFQTHTGHYEFRVMAFGLSGAPATFQKAMNTTLTPLLRKCVLVFFDDILIYSRSYEEHLQHIELVLQLLRRDQWKVKMSKCSFAQRQINYLGHIISQHGVSTDPSKVSAVMDWPIPVNVKELRGFLGLAGYYRKFVKHFGIIAKPLTELLKKGVLFIWTSIHQQAFQALKNALSSAPVLALPDFSVPFCIETDASGVGIGAVLIQKGHPLAYLSKALGPRSKGLSTYEKEYMAILAAIDQWRHYLQYGEFYIFTDQKSLVQLSEQRLHTQWQQKVFTKLLGLQYKIVYKKGVDNTAADALSRRAVVETEQCAIISSASPQWLDSVVASYEQDSHAQSIIARLVLDPAAIAHFTFKDGLLRYKTRIWIGQNETLQRKLLSAFHASALGGHSGVPVTYRCMKQLFAWQGMKKAVHNFVQSCVVCQQAKPDRSRLPGLLQPLPVPSGSWQVISMDFIEGLPQSGHFNCILVVVDVFSKYAHFLPLHHPFTAASVAKVFHNEVYRLHGMPTSIISDRDRVFTSKLWRELFRLADVSLNMSSAYHPQSDGQTERVNQCLETFLRCFVHACPSAWSKWISLAEFWYNNSPHSATGQSPFVVLYGYEPRHFGITSEDSIAVPELADWLQQRHVMTELVHQHLLRAKERMKRQADKKRSERVFQVGDQVFLKAQPYVQSSLAPRANQKLSFKFFGPYQVVERIGSVAYKLRLPSSSLVHPVFHVSQLKQSVGDQQQVTETLPDDSFRWSIPEKIL